jgi:hypothetical protein
MVLIVSVWHVLAAFLLKRGIGASERRFFGLVAILVKPLVALMLT